MGILVKPYKISVWDDIQGNDGRFTEKRLGVIGSNEMTSQNRALDPVLTRTANGERKFTFKMYKKYIDQVTGQKTTNPFVDWLVNERKVKLFYDNEWYDFIVKNISETSTDYLYVYQLEDAQVQELSKNGFGVTFDTQLMNNTGTAGQLAAAALAETDWTVAGDSEIFVEKIEENLLKIKFNSEISAYRIWDQRELHNGVSATTATIPANATGYAFYSSCANKPTRFQFIYLGDATVTTEASSPIINNLDCQYYIDYTDPDSSYTKDSSSGFYLPTGVVFNTSVGASPFEENYKGKRVVFSQKAEYNKLLDRYVQLYKKEENKFSQTAGTKVDASMRDKWAGQRLFYNADGTIGRNVTLENHTTYRLTYDFVITSGIAHTIGGHDQGLTTKRFTVRCGEGNNHYIGQKGGDSVRYTNSIDLNENFKNGKTYSVEYLFETGHLSNDGYTGLYIQPNRGLEGNNIEFQLSNVKLDKIVEYYGYQETEYISPAQIQNLIATPDLNSTAGWTEATMSSSAGATMTENKTIVESVYGYFDTNNTFVSALTQLSNGTFPVSGKTYKSFLKITFPRKAGDNKGVVINSGPTDHRSTLKLPVTGDKWALKYTAYTPSGASANTIKFSLQDCSYNAEKKGYVANTTDPKIVFGDFSAGTGSNSSYNIATVTSCSYTEDNFAKQSKIKLVIESTNTEQNVVYLENIELIRAHYNDEGKIISPNETAELLSKGIIDTTKKYIQTKTLKAATSTDNLAYETVLTGFLPVFNEKGEKTRTINVKESNYFNILQTIAETFEAWLTLKITRDGYGGVIKKEVAFRNYVGKQNYAGFRYGVNVKNISRTLESKNIVTKLMVKPNSNQYAKNKSCAIGRASANPTGEDYIYDFRYFLDRGILNRNQFLTSNYFMTGAQGPDLALYYNKDIIYSSSYATKPTASATIPDLESTGDWYKIANENTRYYCCRDKSSGSPNDWGDPQSYGSLNAQGYFLRLKALNKKAWDETDVYLNSAQDLVKYKAEQEVAIAGFDRANEEIGKIEDEFSDYYFGMDINRTSNNCFKMELATDNVNSTATESEKLGKLEFSTKDWQHGTTPLTLTVTTAESGITVTASNNCYSLSDSSDVFYVTIECFAAEGKSLPESFSVVARPRFYDSERQKYFDKELTFWCKKGTDGKLKASRAINVADRESITFQSYQNKYIEQKANLAKFQADKTRLQSQVTNTQAIYDKQKAILAQYKKQKQLLNQKFFSIYSRFIQEGTWVEEKYLDDDKYYMDALSVMYNSCYPQAAYQIEVLELSQIPGYELLTFELGDKTTIEDPDFFGTDTKEEVVIVEMINNLDRPEQNSMRVQTYKNQFQDLFQKITATVQQAQYSTGSYEKAVALAEATVEQKGQFLADALDSASAKLTAAGQQSVVFGNEGLVITDLDTPSNSIHMIGGAILLSKLDNNGEKKWVTAVTADGISASLLTAGIINTAEINIMTGADSTFKWDALGLTAYDTEEVSGLVSKVDKKQFVRFDKHGIYGIDNSANIDGSSWSPTSAEDIGNNATFALTWDGLKVSGNDGVIAKIGKDDTNIISITKGTGEDNKKFIVSNSGDVTVSGTITATSGQIGGWTLSTSNELYNYIGQADENGYYSQGLGLQTGGTYALAIGKLSPDSWGQAAFRITHAGAVTASNITITGGTLSIGDSNGNPNFYVDSSGNVKLNGNITWGTSASPTQVLYNASSTATKPNWLYKDHTDNKDGSGWYKEIGNRKYASYTFDGGNTWGEVIKIIGDDGISPPQYTIGANGNWFLDDKDTGKKAIGEDGTPVTVVGTYYAAHSSKDVEPTVYGKNGVYPTDISKDKPYLWTKTEFSSGDPVITVSQVVLTRAGLLAALGDETGPDGIYYDPTDSGCIGIKATAIKAGALQIGGTAGDPDSKGVQFYADVSESDVRIGGWKIAELRTSSNPIGTGIFKLFTSGEGENQKTYSSGMAAVGYGDVMAFWAGCEGGTPWQGGSAETTNFYVTQEGKLVAKNAEITGSIKACQNPNDTALGYTEITEQGLYFDTPFSLDLPSYMGKAQCRLTRNYGTDGKTISWSTKYIDIDSARFVNVNQYAYVPNTSVWYTQGWEITPEKMTSRFDYYGSGITVNKDGIVLKFVDPKDTTDSGSARKVYYVTINKAGLTTSNKYEE